jgi:hypothetical protein
MPYAAPQPTLLTQFLQKRSMGTAAAAENILGEHSPEAHNHVAKKRTNYLWRDPGKTPQSRRTP